MDKKIRNYEVHKKVRMNERNFNQQNDFFFAKRLDNVIKLTFKGKVMLPFSYLNYKERLFDYLDLISENDSIKVVMITDEIERSPREEYFDFYNLLSKSKIDGSTLVRMYKAYDQLILRIVESNKFFISVGHGEMISQDFHVDLACDYRIVADNTVIYKPYLELGLVPKGGGAYFLNKKLGHSKAFELLLSNEAVNAHEALQLGIVNRVVHYDELEDSSLKTAQKFAQRPLTSLSRIKKLLNYPLKDLKDYLEFENEELLDILRRSSILK